MRAWPHLYKTALTFQDGCRPPGPGWSWRADALSLHSPPQLVPKSGASSTWRRHSAHPARRTDCHNHSHPLQPVTSLKRDGAGGSSKRRKRNKTKQNTEVWYAQWNTQAFREHQYGLDCGKTLWKTNLRDWSMTETPLRYEVEPRHTKYALAGWKLFTV